jgi:dinuclear metal center YbgI/SA1388 family protein
MATQIDLTLLATALDAELNATTIPDYPQALNGLQLRNASGSVSRVAAAVDASLATIEKVVATGADLLLVHHGLFWNGAQRMDGAVFKKLHLAMSSGLAIYSSHIPLDVHPALGNNAQLMAALGLSAEPFFPWKGIQLGLRAEAAVPRAELVSRLSTALSGGSVHLTPGGPEVCRRIGLITGGAGSEIAAIAATGIDTFISGEGQHWTAALAEELGVNLIYGGHYATETFGVKALAQWIEQQHGLPWQFVDHPSGL